MNKRIGDLGVVVLDVEGDRYVLPVTSIEPAPPAPPAPREPIVVGSGSGLDGVMRTGVKSGELGIIIAESGPKSFLESIKRIQEIKIVDVDEIYKEANARARSAMDDWCCELAYFTDGHSHQDCKEHP